MGSRQIVALLAMGLLLGQAPPAVAQARWYAGAIGSAVLGSQAPLTHDCPASHRMGFGQRLGRELGSSRYAIEGTLRAHFFGPPPASCRYDIPQLPTPVPDGSWTTTGYTLPLLSQPFVSFDVRIRRSLGLGKIAPTVSLGVGQLWQAAGFTSASGNKPFLVGGAGLRFAATARWGISVEGEVLALRGAGTSATATWAGGELQAYDHHGSFRHWILASGLTVSTGIIF